MILLYYFFSKGKDLCHIIENCYNKWSWVIGVFVLAFPAGFQSITVKRLIAGDLAFQRNTFS